MFSHRIVILSSSLLLGGTGQEHSPQGVLTVGIGFELGLFDVGLFVCLSLFLYGSLFGGGGFLLGLGLGLGIGLGLGFFFRSLSGRLNGLGLGRSTGSNLGLFGVLTGSGLGSIFGLM
jgi:hypothetical protein